MGRVKRAQKLILSLFILGQACIHVEPSRGENYVSEVGQNSNNESETVEIPEDDVKEEYLSKQDLEQRQRKLEQAEANYNANPDDEVNVIWFGRRLAYLGRYQEAVNVFSEGLIKNPSSYKLLRHRGHRLITLKKYDEAIEDLTEAVFFSNDAPFEIEPDGIPNTLNRPLTNVKWNIWYHLGLAYYLKGNYDKSISSYKQCMKFASNDDLRVKTTNWLYASYRKIGNDDAADALASLVSNNINLIEGESRIYNDLIKLYQGLVRADILIRRYTANGELNNIIGYGVGNFHLLEGNIQGAQNIFNRVIEGSHKDSFGYLATEADMSALANSLNNSSTARL